MPAKTPLTLAEILDIYTRKARQAASRNRNGYDLAIQLHHAGASDTEALAILTEYAAQVSGWKDHPVKPAEMAAAWKEATQRPRGEPPCRVSSDGQGRRKAQPVQPKSDFLPVKHQQPDTESEALQKALKAARPLEASPAAAYLAARGIDLIVADASGVKAITARLPVGKDWQSMEAVFFPMRNARGDIQACHLRGTGPEKAFQTVGSKAGAVFATADALTSPTVAITEAPIDALSLAGAGLPALAACGLDRPARPLVSLLRQTARLVCLAFDADEAGEQAAACWRDTLEAYGIRTARILPPEGAKDWNEALQRDGKITLPPKACGMPPAVPSPASLPPVTTGKTSQRENAVQRPLEAINAEWLELLEWWRFYQQPTDGKALIVDGVELSPYDLTCRLEFVAELIDHHPAEGWTVKMLTDLREATLRP